MGFGRMGGLRVLALSGGLVACSGDDPEPPPAPDLTETFPRCASVDPLRQPYFGDTHVHTALSLDANLQGTRLRPNEAYAFAKGQPIGIQPYDADGSPLRTIEIDRPLDWAIVSDHAEFLGTVALCEDPESPAYNDASCITVRENPAGAFVLLNAATAVAPENAMYPALCEEGGKDCITAGADVWASIRESAEMHYDRSESCSFTTFYGYEWTAGPETRNLHRNVIFRNHVAPDHVVGYFEAPEVEELWAALQTECLDQPDCDALTIPHNSNLSSGTMFTTLDDDERYDQATAATRARLEPLVEIFQHKGDSECWPGSPVADELCGFEKLPYNNLAGTNLDTEGVPMPRDFVRDILGEGLRYQAELGVNPYAYGIVASTDTHIAAPGLVSEAAYPGHGGAGQSNRDALPEALPDGAPFNPGGLAVLWAEENSREGLFQAMVRREAYGTSGPRIVLRFFGGWDYPANLCSRESFEATGYDDGVPMGGDLPAPPAGASAPTFAIRGWADAGTERAPGVDLQRLQIVKGWLQDGEPQVVVYDVAGDPQNGASVNLATCTPEGTGAAELCDVWTDPDFDPTTPAFYYARAIENPSCRWHTRQCLAAGIACPTEDATWAACCDERVETTVQERAWSSPVFYTPS
ncbi:MAG: DUF3604 domain-containing protein [Myxococcota bacterium]